MLHVFYLIKSLKRILQGVFVIIPTLQMMKLRFKTIKDQLMINNQEVSESEHKAKISQKNSVDDVCNKPSFESQWSQKWLLCMGYPENVFSPLYCHHIEWCS